MSTNSQQPSMNLLPAACMAIGLLIAMPVAHAQTLGGASGPAGDATKVEKCDAPKGTLAVVEPQDAVLQALLKIGLQSPSGMIRLIVQQSNCFLIVERGAAFQNLMQERALASGGQLQLMEYSRMMRTDGYSEIMKTLLDAGADLRLTTDDGTTPLMTAAGLGGATFTPGEPRGYRMTGAEDGVKVLVEAGADINSVNEADYTALHGAAMRGLNEVVQYLVEHGANIDARDFRGRTPFRIAEGAKQSFQFQAFPETAELLKKLGANTKLGIPGTVQERAQIPVAVAAN